MNTRKYRWILYFITLTIIITLAVQFYWNYQNYQLNKQRVVNDIQISLDNAIEEYYAQIAKNDFMTIIESDANHFTLDHRFDSLPETDNNSSSYARKITLKQLGKKYDEENPNLDTIFDNLQYEFRQKLRIKDSLNQDSISGFTQWAVSGEGFTVNRPNEITKIQMFNGRATYDSLKIFSSLRPILIAFQRDSLNYKKLDSLILTQLAQKNTNLNYSVLHTKANDFSYHTNQDFDPDGLPSVNALSTYLKPKENLTLYYPNPFAEAFKRSLSGILISFLLALAIIACLFYLLNIIKAQKQLAEVKNDLISNITHEFKTPIATIGVALESIKDFKVLDDKTKTESYLNISNQQLSKLNTMVEKLLETASLDSENLDLNKSEIDLIELVQLLIDKHGMHKGTKEITFEFNPAVLLIKADVYHIENALNNILDNAIKYGGEKIKVDISSTNNLVNLSISDNGQDLSSAHKNKIFEKFYRVPKGNTHDVKGFGIGLYYTKKIIEKHGGQIQLDLANKQTSFNITLPIE